MTRSCVTLLSGGLDSLLVLKLMVEAGLEVTALHTLNCFHGTEKAAERKERLAAAAKRLGAADIVFPDITEEVIGRVRTPRYGYGKNLNPCIDCRLETVAAGFRAMRDRGADFVASGEVVGQRPMSQRRDAMALADKIVTGWGYGGLFLRPLSAGLLPKTIPETEGWVTPDVLFSISGRGRHRQMELAEELGIGEYPSPAGGCLLTDAGFSGRLADLMRFVPGWTAEDVELLKVGRHFLADRDARIVVSRNQSENRRLEELSRPEDELFINDRENGAVVLLRGRQTPENRALAAGLAAYYSKSRAAGRARIRTGRLKVEDMDGLETLDAAAVHPDDARAIEETVKKE